MSFWQDKKVLITGANGFIGSWLTKELLDRSAQVTTITQRLKGNSNFNLLKLEEKINFVEGNITDYDLIIKILKEFNIDTCFHLAAQSTVQIAEKSIISTFESNIQGTWVLLEALKNCNVKRVIVASSDKVYGNQKELPNHENQRLLGRNPYGASKVCTDIIAQTYAHTYKLPVAITRNANTYGPGDLNLSRLIPSIIVSVLKNEPPIIRSDGTPERDYLYIEDAINAYLTLAENLHRTEVIGESFNFGSGKPTSVLDLFNMIIKLSGKDLTPRIIGEAKNEVDKQYLSITKAEQILGWRPKTNLEEGLKQTMKWYQEKLSNLDI